MNIIRGQRRFALYPATPSVDDKWKQSAIDRMDYITAVSYCYF